MLPKGGSAGRGAATMEAMPDFCHRCHAELQSSAPATYGNDGIEAALYCPHCGAPQLRLPEYMREDDARSEPDAANEDAPSTGRTPPPSPRAVDWRAALASALMVALVAAVLVVAGLKFPFVSFISTLWILGAAAIALGLYTRRRPEAWVDAGIGVRVGLATGVLMVATIALALATTGVILRFGMHGMSGFDSDVAQQMAAMQQQLAQRMVEQQQPAALRDHMLGFLQSPEVRGGLALFYLAASGLIILLFAAGGGAFAGMLRHARRASRTSK